ncbi:hypothetical protein [Haliangium ochraceum]|uniref:Alpha/beta hydrolase n=1 Tax=Haliangium ochraceum (strain DSM 14365 / JCM 11303 / SMP-2) TaxID=502025 RepID=D0LFS5_HALO1|nr:hypothetical protein [Haliangium ochraceum]ACY14527.1 hypothetical protein Hoch_1981 [Haliangium ochraceum DSM 14365]
MLARCLPWLVFLLALAPAARADSQPSRSRTEPMRPVLEGSDGPVAGGQHWRIRSANGPIHIWVPPGYDRATAGTVIYVHGYHVDVDQAWTRHKLPQQFRASRQNALFIVPEAPRSNGDRIYWESLAELKKTVRRAGMRMPDGPTIAVAHSGGFRTLASWVDNRLLAQVILLDAMYGRIEQFDDFIHSGKRAQHHKMLLVAAHTAAQSKEFIERFRYAAVRDRIPDSYTAFSDRERRSKLLYLRSQYGHSQIVAGGKVLPLILRLTPLGRL